jgi:Glyoxalase/Bleomycin resistance protein/Dioxygenase superfamily
MGRWYELAGAFSRRRPDDVGHCPDAMLPAQTGDHSYFAYLHVDDVDALYTEFVQRGAIVRQPPTDRLWGMREMAVATPDGQMSSRPEEFHLRALPEPFSDRLSGRSTAVV